MKLGPVRVEHAVHHLAQSAGTTAGFQVFGLSATLAATEIACNSAMCMVMAITPVGHLLMLKAKP
jgi:hypothetical protein